MARYTNEMRERAVRMVAEVRLEHLRDETAALRHVAGLLGMERRDPATVGPPRPSRRRSPARHYERGCRGDQAPQARGRRVASRERDLEVRLSVFRQGARPPHDEMIQLHRRAQGSVRGRGHLPGTAPGSSWGSSPPAGTAPRQPDHPLGALTQGRAARPGDRQVARGELRRLRGAEDARPDAPSGLGTGRDPDRAG